MEVQTYVDIALKTYLSSGNTINDLSHFILSLAEESGEVAGTMKRHYRGDFDLMAEKSEQDKIIKELGDCLWYINAIAHALGSSLEEVMKLNNEKLIARLNAGTLRGRGDNR